MCKRSWVAASLFLALLTSSSYPQFYNGSSGRVPLTVDSNKVLIKFEVSFSPSGRNALIGGIKRIVGILQNEYLIDDFECCSLSTVVHYSSFLDSLDTLDGIYLVEPYYRLEDGTPFPVGETFCVAFDTSFPPEGIDSINAEHGVAMGRKLYGFESVYVLNNTDSSHMRILDLANEYYDMPETHFAHPNFAISFEPFSYKLYDFYGHLQNNIKKVVGDFNQKTVWDFAGLNKDVVVAIIDDGVESHEDLPASRVLPGWDFYDGDDSPISGKSAHGMGSAGIIGASHTTDSAYAGGPYPWTGVISLNPKVKVLPIKIFNEDYGVSVPVVAEAFNFARTHGAEVVSNSWGFWKCTSFPVID